MSTENLPALTPEIVAPRTVSLVKAPRLTPQKRRFCEVFLSTFNVKKAVQESKITSVKGCLSHDFISIGSALLAEAGVQDYMRWMTTRDATDIPVARGRIRGELAALAFADVSDAIEYGPKDEEGYRPVKRIRMDKIDGRLLSAIKITELKNGKQQIEFKMHPKVQALTRLGEEQRMFGDDGNVTLPNVNIQINL